MTEVVYFYSLAFFLILSALGVVILPKMYMSVFSFFCVILFSSVVYTFFNARYLATFQFILCGILLVSYIVLLLKKIGRLNLSLKLVSKPKVLISLFFVFLIGGFGVLFFITEKNGSLTDLFAFVCETATDRISFLDNLFPLYLMVILMLVCAAVVRVLLLSEKQNFVNSEFNDTEREYGDSNA